MTNTEHAELDRLRATIVQIRIYAERAQANAQLCNYDDLDTNLTTIIKLCQRPTTEQQTEEPA